MADAIVFHFQPKTSPLHRFDPRLKTLSLLFFSPAIMATGLMGLGIVTPIIALTGASVGLKWRLVIWELRYFSVLLLMVFLSRAVFIPGKILVDLGPIALTDLGMISGTTMCLRLALIAAAGLIYAASTRPKEIRVAVQWLTAPIPGLPEKRLALMVGLLVRLIPLLLDQIRETIAVQNARCIQCRKNPYYRLTRFAMPVMRKTIQRADHLVSAMMARCYRETPTLPAMQIQITDWVIFILILSMNVLLILSGTIVQ